MVALLDWFITLWLGPSTMSFLFILRWRKLEISDLVQLTVPYSIRFGKFSVEKVSGDSIRKAS